MMLMPLVNAAANRFWALTRDVSESPVKAELAGGAGA